jgi:hypothetical protein
MHFAKDHQSVDITEVDFEVKFDRDMTGIKGVEDSEMRGTGDTSKILCDISRTSENNMPEGHGFTYNDNSRRLETDDEDKGRKL